MSLRSARVCAMLLAATSLVRAGDALSFDDIVRLVQASTEPAAVLAKTGGTVFTFSEAERGQLTQAGAPPALVAALQKPRMNLADVQNVALILDCSGSMKEMMPDGRTKMDTAKAVVGDVVRRIPTGMNVCLVIYGHDAPRKCQAVDVARPLAPLQDADRDALIKTIDGLKPTGNTPIALALRTAGEQLKGADGLSQIVLVTDGAETCHGDPAAEAEKLALQLNLRSVDVIGLSLSKEEKSAVVAIAGRALGQFLEARTAGELAAGMKQVVKVEPVRESEPEVKLAASVQSLVEQLVDASIDVRAVAAESLEGLGAKAKPAARYLADRIADDAWGDWKTRDNEAGNTSKDAALKALRKHGPEKVEGALARAAKSRNVAVRVWAAGRLGEYLAAKAAWDGTPPALAALMGMLKEGHVDSRGAAALALAPLGPKAKAAGPALADRIADDAWGDWQTRDNEAGKTTKDAAVAALQKVAPDLVDAAVARAMKSKETAVRQWATKKIVEIDK